MSASEERERTRAWVERQRAEYARGVAEQETIEQALIALQASREDEREARIVHAVKAQLEAEFAAPEDDAFDREAWERAIASGAIGWEEARSIARQLHYREAHAWLADAESQSRWSRREADEEPRDLLRGAGAYVLSVLPSLRELEGVDEAVRLIERCETWGDELRAAIAQWSVAMLRADANALRAADDALHAVSDRRLCGATDEDGPQFDRRPLIVERLLDAGELALALRWWERIWRGPVRIAVGQNDLGIGPPIALATKLRRAVTAEHFVAIEKGVFETLCAKKSTTFEWLALADCSSTPVAAEAVERAVQLVETTGALIPARKLDRAMQHRVSIAMADRASEWIETVNCIAADDQVMGETTLSARLRAIPLVDEECAGRAWPAIEELVGRARYGTYDPDRREIAHAVVECADKGVDAARALLARWRATGENGWTANVGDANVKFASELLSVVLMRVPFDERLVWIQRFERECGLGFRPLVRVGGLPATDESIRWLLAQSNNTIEECLSLHDREMPSDHYWRALDVLATRGMYSSQRSPFARNGPLWELSAWLQRERDWEGSRWAWTRSELLRWIERGEPEHDRHWVFEPGADAIVRRLRDDDEGRAALGSLFSQLVERVASESTPSKHAWSALTQLAPFASRDMLRSCAERVRARDPEPYWRAEIGWIAERFGRDFLDQVFAILDVTPTAARVDRALYVPPEPLPFEQWWSEWIAKPLRSVRPLRLVSVLSLPSVRGLIEWALERARKADVAR